MYSKNDSIQKIVIGGLLAAVVFVATCLSFPNGAGGYTHLGDAMIVLTVMFIGGKRGALSAGIGAMLADLILGYAMWAPISLVSKALMALIIGSLLNSSIFGLKGRARWFIAVLAGVIFETLCYSAAGFCLEGGVGGAIAEACGMIIQGGLAIVVGLILSEALQKSPLKNTMIHHTDNK